MNNSNTLRSCVLCSAASVLALAGAAQAQETSAVGEVVVTASRIQSAGFTAPTPTTVLGTAELTRRAPTTVLETINDVPSFRPSTTPQNTSSPTNGANSGAGNSTVDLRGLGGSRTLLLVNGRRAGATGDLNQFPTIMVQRIDIVTGGASAAYGSDAVAGVVNIVLDTKFNGLKGDFQYGVTKYGDDKTWTGSLAYGGSFFGGRAHLLIGGQYQDEGGVLTADPITKDRRPWIAANRGLQIANPCPQGIAVVSAACPTGGNGLPPFVDVDNENFSTMNPGGLITAGPLKGITFEDGGVPRQFQYGLLLGNNMIGGDTTGVNPSIFNLRPEMKRYAMMAHLDFKLTDKTNLWLEYSNAQLKAQVLAVRPRDQGNLSVSINNAFLPASIRAQMVTLNLTTLTMGRFNNDGVQPTSYINNDVFRYAGGLDGEFGLLGKRWTWDAFGQFGRYHQHPVTVGSRNTARWLQALDSVVNAQGVAVCRNAAGGCVPFNIFGPNAASQAARDFIFGTQSADTDLTQTNAGFNFHGEPVSTWAGPVALALGGEYRKQTSNSTSDPIASAGGWDSGNGKPLKGQFHVTEGYAEIAVPLAKDMALAKSLDFNGAIRYAKYSSVKKGVTTWKVGGTWEPIQELLLRSTYSLDIRAPSINELFSIGTSARNNIVQFQGPLAGQSALTDFVGGGNPNLTPEKAKTFTAGGSIRPKFARLRFSADYFSIKVRDQIGTLGAQDVVNLCRDGRTEFCSLLTFNSVGTVLAVLNTSVNNARFATRGWDLEASYVLPLGDLPVLRLPGTLTARALATKVIEFAQTDQTGRTDRHGQNATTTIGTTGVPEWVANYTLSYEVGRFTGGAQFRYIGPGVLETQSITGTATTRLNNKLSSQVITNVSASYVLINSGGRRLQLFGAVNNLFNRGTPFPVFPLTMNGYGYDNLGMVMRAGVRFQY